jgi:hypothetical protein
MEAHSYRTLFDIMTKEIRPRPPAEGWYLDRLPGMRDQMLKVQALAERDWIQARRPYYTVYPVAAEALGRVKLEVQCDVIKLPLPELLIRFGVGHEADCSGEKLRAIFVAATMTGPDTEGLSIWCDFGETAADPRTGRTHPLYSYLCFSLDGTGKTVEQSVLDLGDAADGASKAALSKALRYVIAICLLGEDSELVDRDVLSKDRLKWDETGDPKILDRAIRGGKVGWLVGADVRIDESSPHVRRPHFGLRWTGEGRRIPKVVPISGCVVKGKKLTEVPTGYEGGADS